MLLPGKRAEIGQVSISSTTMNAELTLHGRSMPMKQSGMGDKFTLEAARGRFKWKIDQINGCLGKMMDGRGTVVARYKGGGLPRAGERRLEICVPCDLEMSELILLSAMAGRALNKTNFTVGMNILKYALLG